MIADVIALCLAGLLVWLLLVRYVHKREARLRASNRPPPLPLRLRRERHERSER